MDVIHDQETQEFYLQIDHEKCLMDYTIVDEHTLDFYHTFTPIGLRGHGYAAMVVKAALDYAAENHLKVIPTCSYVKAFISQHKEYFGLTT